MVHVRRTVASVVVPILVALGGLVAGVVGTGTAAGAADPSTFTPGSIISDSLFFDGGAMTAGDVQAFLVAKGAACTAGALCLKNYVATSTAQPAEAGLCDGYPGGAVQTAAQIVAQVGASCGISQKALLVTLQKENGLVTATAPTDARYRTAMGFGCPDTAPCDTQYYGFFNQVYKAARQFKRYAANPQNYSYRAGRVNTILFHPNSACGSSSVYIDNQATAGLYAYTPYQPNASALGNLYGTGDSCASYGNRNFWRDYTDWFGSTNVGASLVHSSTDPTVYLVTFDRKYPITDLATFESLSALGPLGLVPQSFLDARPTGVRMGRFVRDRSGTIYLVDRGRVYAAADCAQLEHWGVSCASYADMTLSDVQMSKFVKAGVLTYSVTTPEGKRFAVFSGAKHEVADDAAAASNWPASTPAMPLSEAALAYLPYGAPVVLPGVVVRDRSTGADVLVDTDRSLAIASGITDLTRLRNLSVRSLDHASVVFMTAANATIDGVVKSPDGTAYALTADAAVRLAADQLTPLVASAPTVTAGIMSTLGTADAGTLLVRSAQSSSLYLATKGKKRPVPSTDVATALTGTTRPRVAVVSQAALDSVPTGPTAVAPARLIKAAGAPTIYFTDGLDKLWPLASFSLSDALGVRGWTEVDPAVVAASTVSSTPLSAVIGCGAGRFVAADGRLVPVDGGVVAASGVPVTTLDPATCSALPSTGAMGVTTVFVKSPDSPVVYQAVDGVKRPLTSMETALGQAAPGPMLIALVPQSTIDAMPSGAPVLTPGTLVKSLTGVTIYLVDGASTLVPLSSFAISDALGIRSWSSVPAASVAWQKVASLPLGTAVSCGAWRAVALGGRLVPVDTAVFDASGVPTNVLSQSTCAAIPKATGTIRANVFIKTPDDPTLYVVVGGTKRFVSNMTQLNTLSNGLTPLIVQADPSVVASIPTGPPL